MPHVDSFDVAVVGAGSAGCALVGRLASRGDLRIALIEAGPDYGPLRSGSWPSRASCASIRENVTNYAHPVGTCRMGPSPDTGDVVDRTGCVHGLTNVYVADASIVPIIPRANVNLTCFVIGSRVAGGLLHADR